MEEFRKIEGFDNYEISNLGNVRNIKTGLILKPTTTKKGYNQIGLRKDSKLKSHLIHRLVASAFITNPLNKPYIDHIDNNRSNNIVENLRWATSQENCRNAKLYSNNTTGIKGVVFNKNLGQWMASIQLNKTRIHIGKYDTLEEAKQARKNKAIELFGEFINQCEI